MAFFNGVVFILVWFGYPLSSASIIESSIKEIASSRVSRNSFSESSKIETFSSGVRGGS